MDATTTSAGDWFDRINTAAITWYGVYTQNQPVSTLGAPSASMSTVPGGVAASVSLPILIAGVVLIVGVIYVLKKA